MTGDRHDPIGPIGHLAQLAQVVVRRQHEALAAFGIAGFVHAEHPTGRGAQMGVGLPLREPPPVARVAVPRRVGQEVVQLLAVGARDERGQFHHRLVVLTW